MVPNGPFLINRYLKNNPTPYIILTDKGSKVAAHYFQIKQFFAVGTPSVFILNQKGKILYTDYSTSIKDEPGSDNPLAVLTELVK